MGRTISVSFSSSTCHLGGLVCRNVLELSSSLWFASPVLQLVARDLSDTGWQQTGKGQTVPLVRVSCRSPSGEQSTQGLLEVS